MKVVGIDHKTGSFTDKQTNTPVIYDNWELHCICNDFESPENFTSGSAVTVIKVKAADYAASCNAAKISSVHDLIGVEISPNYQVSGRFVKCTGFRVIGKIA